MSRPGSRYASLLAKRAASWLQRATAAGVMHQTLRRLSGKRVELADGTRAVEFLSCSYLGLDRDPAVIAAAKQALDEWGVHLCTARTRLSIALNAEVEERLAALFSRPTVTFPSVTTAHAAALPLLARGLLPVDGLRPGTRLGFVFDRFAHASMRALSPYLEAAGPVRVVGHNDMDALERVMRRDGSSGRRTVYLCDGVYSMGGECPVADLRGLVERHRPILYIDDAHGTSIVGRRGEGFLRSSWPSMPRCVVGAFSLAKGFGCNGGGLMLPDRACERAVRRLATPYAFSGPLDFSILGAARAVLARHEDGSVRALQGRLRANMALFDERFGVAAPGVSPVRAVPMPDEPAAIAAAAALRRRGLLVSAAFFPVVPLGSPVLRLALSALHAPGEVRRLADELLRVAPRR